jgi:hypothetical protein
LAVYCFSREKKTGEQFHLALKYLRFVAEIIRGDIGASRRACHGSTGTMNPRDASSPAHTSCASRRSPSRVTSDARRPHDIWKNMKRHGIPGSTNGINTRGVASKSPHPKVCQLLIAASTTWQNSKKKKTHKGAGPKTRRKILFIRCLRTNAIRDDINGER